LRMIDDYRYALVNDALDEAASEMRAIVLTARAQETPPESDLAARCLTRARSPRLEAALANFGILGADH